MHARASSTAAGRGASGFAAGVLLVVGTILLPAAPARADGYCSVTARTLFRACGNEVRDDYWVAAARCVNVEAPAKRHRCFVDAYQEREEGYAFCAEQRDWRFDACEVLGEARYDPDFDPALFDADPRNPTNPNPYFPLDVGNRWVYKSPGERDVVQVLGATKLIDGVRCLVVRDQVSRGGKVVEDTDDWYALALAGDVWYCGEEVKDYETYVGDHPRTPELVSIDGSFKAGRDGDKPGRIFLASPQAGDAYLEEFSLGNAEDVTEILSATYSYGQDPELDDLVPPGLANLFCSGDCVVTKNYSLLEPEIVARKYYAPGIGPFLEIELDEDRVVRLVGCNFDPRCASLSPE